MRGWFNNLSVKLQYWLSSESVVDHVERAATKSAYAASGLTFVSGLTVNEWGVIVGMILGFATFGFNVWFKLKYGRGENNEE